MGGSTDQVARYKLGAALAEAAPYLLLLSATPHQGKTDQFLRLMQLIDRESFPDEGSVSRDRVRPFVIRTEKRNSIDAEGQPLFKPRVTSDSRPWLGKTGTAPSSVCMMRLPTMCAMVTTRHWSPSNGTSGS